MLSTVLNFERWRKRLILVFFVYVHDPTRWHVAYSSSASLISSGSASFSLILANYFTCCSFSVFLNTVYYLFATPDIHQITGSTDSFLLTVFKAVLYVKSPAKDRTFFIFLSYVCVFWVYLKCLICLVLAHINFYLQKAWFAGQVLSLRLPDDLGHLFNF